MGRETETPPRKEMGPGSQTGSDIIQSPPPVDRMTDASESITLPQTSFAGGKIVSSVRIVRGKRTI